HERWTYDERRRVQALRRLICLCTDCHTSTHYGLAQLRGLAAEALSHLRAVTGMSADEAEVHVESAFRLWEGRSRLEWTLDLRVLTGAGVAVRKPPPAGDRVGVVEARAAVVRSPQLEPEDAEADAAEAVELVRMLRGSEFPVEGSDTIRVRLSGGRYVSVDPRDL
ncbi:MAG: hypothetical protein ACRDT2_19010, partial [Natronosporangium sp.]